MHTQVAICLDLVDTLNEHARKAYEDKEPRVGVAYLTAARLVTERLGEAIDAELMESGPMTVGEMVTCGDYPNEPHKFEPGLCQPPIERAKS